MPPGRRGLGEGGRALAFEIRRFGAPVLKTRAREVAKFYNSLKHLTQGMLETLRAGEGRIAIAANQAGVPKRVSAAETGHEVYVLINPMIEEKTPETETALEGCLSISGIGVEVERHSGAVVSGQDEEGRPVRHEVEGEIARMMQHETDHLDGLLMLSVRTRSRASGPCASGGSACSRGADFREVVPPTQVPLWVAHFGSPALLVMGSPRRPEQPD